MAKIYTLELCESKDFHRGITEYLMSRTLEEANPTGIFAKAHGIFINTAKNQIISIWTFVEGLTIYDYI